MLHVVGFRDGKAFYRNRFVRTDGFLAENEAGGPLWAGLAEPVGLAKRDHGWGARGLMKDASSTDVIVHRGTALTSFYQCGDLYRLDPYSGDTLGKEAWNGAFPFDWGVSAHPKVDDAPASCCSSTTASRRRTCTTAWSTTNDDLVHYVDVPLPGPRLPHDMAFTENYAILNDFPLFWDPELLERNAHVAAVPPRHAVALRGDPPPRAELATSGGSRPNPPTSCTSPTPTRTATRSCSTASSRATRNRPTTAWATSGSGRFASWRSTACRPGCTGGGSTWPPGRYARSSCPTASPSSA